MRTHTTRYRQRSPAPRPFFQAKLTINTPGDAYEQEADRVADQVMQTPATAPSATHPASSPSFFAPSAGGVQRKCAACEHEEKEKQGIQRKEGAGASPSPTAIGSMGDASGKAAPPVVNDVLSSGGGQPMDDGTRHFMESRFGQDFSQVRIHTDPRAAESASAIQARAYTSGRDVVFGAGEYQPSSEGGRKLLAHELAHVGQQRKLSSVIIQRSTDDTSADKQQQIDELNDQIKKLDYIPLVLEDKEMVERGAERDRLVKQRDALVASLAASKTQKQSSTPGRRTIGWHPQDTKGGPYAHITEATTETGSSLQAGLGLLHTEGNDNAKMDVLSANAEIGLMGSKKEKNRRFGMKADAQIFNGTTGDGKIVGGDAGVIGASAEASIGEDGATLGAQSYVAQAGGRYGEWNPKNARDEQLRFGIGYGAGAALRGYWGGDKDNDKHEEYGIGFDAGPISVDMKTEDPALKLLEGINPLYRWTIPKNVNLTSELKEKIGYSD